MVKYVIDSYVDFPCSTKRTPIIDMMHNNMADMVNADDVHNGWLDALCHIILLLFDVGLYSLWFYERKVVYVSSGDNFDVFCVSVSKAAHNI